MQVEPIGGRMRWRIPLLLAALLPAGCDDSLTDPALDPEAPPDGRTTLSVYLTDAPGEVANVWVSVEDVVLVGGEGGPISLLEEPTGLVNLLDLQDDVMLLVEETEVPEGRYSQVRFVIGGGVLETVGGQVYVQGGAEHPDGLEATGTLHCPSCAQTGIKVTFPGGIDLHEGANGILLDFDVAQSFGRQAGQSGRWVMRPLIKGVVALPEEIEDGELGASILGTVVLDLGVDGNEDPIQLPVCAGQEITLEDFVPRASTLGLTDDEGQPIRFVGATGADGTFVLPVLPVLPADDYALDHWTEIQLEGALLEWDAEVIPGTVAVAEGSDVEGVVYTITGATCTVEEES